MKVISFILWILVGIPLFIPMIIATWLYPMVEKYQINENGNLLVEWLRFIGWALTSIILFVPSAFIAQVWYPKWEKWGEGF